MKTIEDKGIVNFFPVIIYIKTYNSIPKYHCIIKKFDDFSIWIAGPVNHAVVFIPTAFTTAKALFY